MGAISRDTTWSDGDELTASDLNGEFNNILATVNGDLDDDNIAADAAIADTKLDTISTADKVADTAISEAAAGVDNEFTGATTLGLVYGWNMNTGLVTAISNTDNINEYLIGVGTGTAAQVRLFGKMTISGGSLTVGPVYLGDNGALVSLSDIDSGDYVVRIGFAKSATVLIVNVDYNVTQKL